MPQGAYTQYFTNYKIPRKLPKTKEQQLIATKGKEWFDENWIKYEESEKILACNSFQPSKWDDDIRGAILHGTERWVIKYGESNDKWQAPQGWEDHTCAPKDKHGNAQLCDCLHLLKGWTRPIHVNDMKCNGEGNSLIVFRDKRRGRFIEVASDSDVDDVRGANCYCLSQSPEECVCSFTIREL
eukprot:Seg3589.7 transcript_id=Seg3589.7/GoldUCD/mRNA.D3Y31 product="hypothetical protein" protein_id=Seg3589.7/GoldUCD/D3Y31